MGTIVTSRRPNGFTLIEMIVVLAILGLVLGLVLARGPMHSARLDAEAAARDLASTLRLARGRAIAENRPVSVVLAPNRYQVEGLVAHGVPSDVALAGNAVIRFAPDGSSSGGTIAVRTVNASVTIVVNWLTGRVEMTQAQ